MRVLLLQTQSVEVKSERQLKFMNDSRLLKKTRTGGTSAQDHHNNRMAAFMAIEFGAKILRLDSFKNIFLIQLPETETDLFF